MSSPVIPRPRISRLLAAAWERRVTLVVAGGGYGKTTALRELAGDERSHWIALSPADREIETLAGRIAAALGAGDHPSVTAPIAALGASDRRALAEGRAAAVCGLIEPEGTDPLLLLLDDVDQVADDAAAGQFLSSLCLQAPSRLHVVLSGRQLPVLRLGSARGRGELIELAAPDLAFTPEETGLLLVDRLGPSAQALTAACWSLTAGWAAALQLIVDRLERLDPPSWQPTVDQLRLRRGSVWRDFALELVQREDAAAQRILAVASVAPALDAALLEAVGVPAAEPELESLQARGLLVASGDSGVRTLSPVLAEAVAERADTGQAADLRHRATVWLERRDRLEEALECAAAGDAEDTLTLLRRCGERLVARGYGMRVAEVLRELGTGDDLALGAILAEALVAVGDWDGAMEVFAAMQRQTVGRPLPAQVAWRLGALLYLRSDFDGAKAVLSAAYAERGESSDDALVAAWLSSTLWGHGEVEDAQRAAEVALRLAEATDDSAARAAAHVAVALVAASHGDRERNERHYRLALAASAKAGDSIQLARIHANLSSRAAEEGDYAGAIREADLAISAGAGHNLFSALAMSNKAEALMRTGELEEAQALVSEAVEMFTSLGSLLVCAAHAQLGALYTERGDLARAHRSLERTHRLAEEAGDVHALVGALAGLAQVLAEEDPDTARDYARQAVQRATSLERAYALCAWSWVELLSGDRGRASKLSAEAQAEARRTGDSPSLARALELSAVSSQPVDEGELEAACRLWREVGDPIASQRAELALAACRGDSRRAQELRQELSRRGVQPELGVARLVLVAGETVPGVAVSTLGRFAVSRGGQPIPLAAWQSRKARDLLKLLAARRGRPVTRDAAAEALWPDEAPAPLGNRLSVALSTLRKVLDPERLHPADHFIAGDNQSLALRIEHLSLDVADFVETARAGAALASRGDWTSAEPLLRQAEQLYTGDFLEEDLYEDWAVDCREEARSLAQEVSRLLARASIERGDGEDATRHLRRLLERDPYDADAWTAFLGAQLRLQRYGEARRQHAVYARRMAELGIAPVPLARTVDARP